MNINREQAIHMDKHRGCEVTIVVYQKDGTIFNSALECETHHEVILDHDYVEWEVPGQLSITEALDKPSTF
jgi:hypothetical protein